MTFEELLQGMLDQVPGDVDKRQGSVIYDALAPAAYFLAQQGFLLNNYVDLIFPDSAVDDYLDRAVSAYGITRKEATAAVRKMTTSAPVQIGTRWEISSVTYTVTAEAGTNMYEVTCDIPGDIGNQYSGAMLPVSNGISGVTAELTDILTPGTDRETDEALRERFYQKVRLPVTSGNAYHYKMWALEVPGVGDAKVFPLDNGPGTVGVLIVNSDRTIESSLEKKVADHIETVRPIGASVTVSSPKSLQINVTANVLLDGSKKIQDVLEAFKVAFSEYLKSLVFNIYRVSYAQVGKLLLETPGVQDYEQLKLNEQSGNIPISEKQIPEIGTVNLSEVVTLGSV